MQRTEEAIQLKYKLHNLMHKQVETKVSNQVLEVKVQVTTNSA